jgi:sulfur relay (sulfurtransferase) complex TusBCD TusD component (DsrE family)
MTAERRKCRASAAPGEATAATTAAADSHRSARLAVKLAKGAIDRGNIVILFLFSDGAGLA